ncbi:MAG: hypothetical protein KIT72_00685 [Polyangiaceae bacterium]|nr:hypothetical protein [Polyangiaceae bacterium]MCW5788912.1 hypothetical protein [Polyangiaceae bacterium]
MVGRLGRRAVEALVLLFALLGFSYVPLGEHTGLEHTRAIMSTDAARRAARELAHSWLDLRQRWLGDPRGNLPAPAPSGGADQPSSEPLRELLSKSAPAEPASAEAPASQ